MRIMVLGDTHGNADWLRLYIYPTAVALKVDRIVQVGDWGYWEHQPAGVAFVRTVNRIATSTGIPMYWLRGNHDKASRLLKKYRKRDDDGFIEMNDGLFFIPDGTLWSWQGRTFRAFGGAYSVDKSWRLNMEARDYEHLVEKEADRAKAEGRAPKPVPSQAGMLWFPEEQMSDADMTRFLTEDSSRLDYVFSHDKPRQSNPGWNRKDLPLCLPNQDRLQRALNVHEPLYWFHGHLHHHYVQDLKTGPTGRVTTVVSLDPDDQAAEMNWKRENSWALLDLVGTVGDTVTLGAEAIKTLDRAAVNEARLAVSAI